MCFCLGITAVDPTEIDLLFERFISADRREPPDIDVDFEHERREEVIQYIYGRYGRERAAICATVIHYRPRMAIREVGKAMGLKEDVTAGLAGLIWGEGDGEIPDEHIREAGLDPANPAIRQAIGLARELLGFPRHLSQHVGGFVLTRERLDETVPIDNAAMEDRTFIEWDKDDIDALGMLKVDVLALGMLTCIRKGFDLIERHYGRTLTLATVPHEDPAVYEMLCRADSVGVFQVESRAQMSMLPRLKPRVLLRPRHRGGDRAPRPDPGRHGASLPAPARRARAGRLSLQGAGGGARQDAGRAAVPGAGDADRHRRGRLHARRGRPAAPRHGHLPPRRHHPHLPREVHRRHGRQRLQREFAERCFSQIEGFGEYGFPESHAASFALLVYVSSWIKSHYPDAFCAAILNSQPMGFYQPAQLVRDAREHGVEVRHPDINCSDWDCTLEPALAVSLALRGEGRGAGCDMPGLAPALTLSPQGDGESGIVRRPPRPAPRRRAGGGGDQGDDPEGARQRLCRHPLAVDAERRSGRHAGAAGRRRCLPLHRASIGAPRCGR